MHLGQDSAVVGRQVLMCAGCWHMSLEVRWLLAQEKAAARSGSGDEMIISAGDFLVAALRPAARRLAWERATLGCAAFAAIGELIRGPLSSEPVAPTNCQQVQTIEQVCGSMQCPACKLLHLELSGAWR